MFFSWNCAAFYKVQCFDKMQNSLLSASGKKKITSQLHAEVLHHPVLKFCLEAEYVGHGSPYRIRKKADPFPANSRIISGRCS